MFEIVYILRNVFFMLTNNYLMHLMWIHSFLFMPSRKIRWHFEIHAKWTFKFARKIYGDLNFVMCKFRLTIVLLMGLSSILSAQDPYSEKKIEKNEFANHMFRFWSIRFFFVHEFFQTYSCQNKNLSMVRPWNRYCFLKMWPCRLFGLSGVLYSQTYVFKNIDQREPSDSVKN